MKRSLIALVLGLLLFSSHPLENAARQGPTQSPAKEQARPTRDWVRDGVVYEIFPRQFSPQRKLQRHHGASRRSEKSRREHSLADADSSRRPLLCLRYATANTAWA